MRFIRTDPRFGLILQIGGPLILPFFPTGPRVTDGYLLLTCRPLSWCLFDLQANIWASGFIGGCLSRELPALLSLPWQTTSCAVYIQSWFVDSVSWGLNYLSGSTIVGSDKRLIFVHHSLRRNLKHITHIRRLITQKFKRNCFGDSRIWWSEQWWSILRQMW